MVLNPCSFLLSYCFFSLLIVRWPGGWGGQEGPRTSFSRWDWCFHSLPSQMFQFELYSSKSSKCQWYRNSKGKNSRMLADCCIPWSRSLLPVIKVKGMNHMLEMKTPQNSLRNQDKFPRKTFRNLCYWTWRMTFKWMTFLCFWGRLWSSKL